MYRCRACRVPGASGAGRKTGRPANAASYRDQISCRRTRFCLDPGELVEAERRLEVGHVVLEARLHDLVVVNPLVGEALPGVRVEAVQRERLEPLRGVGSRGS